MKAIETACRAHRMVSTSTDITLPIFADGSRRGANGAYAVPFKHYAPGTEDHGRKVSAGWPVFHQTTNGCELLAIKQAIKVAIIELTTLERQLPPETKAKVQVQIFDDGMFPLEHLSGIKDTMPNESDHISSVYRWSQRFRERFAGRNSPLEVKLQLLWVPGHVDKVKLHRKADEVAGKVSEITMPLLTVGGEERPCRHWNSVIQNFLGNCQILVSKRNHESLEKRVSRATTTTMNHASIKTSKRMVSRTSGSRELPMTTTSTAARVTFSLKPITKVRKSAWNNGPVSAGISSYGTSCQQSSRNATKSGTHCFCNTSRKVMPIRKWAEFEAWIRCYVP